MHSRSAEAPECLKSTYGQIQDGGLRPNWKWLNRNNSAADCPILLKFRKLVHYGPREQRRKRQAGGEASGGNASLITKFSGYYYYFFIFKAH